MMKGNSMVQSKVIWSFSVAVRQSKTLLYLIELNPRYNAQIRRISSQVSSESLVPIISTTRPAAIVPISPHLRRSKPLLSA